MLVSKKVGEQKKTGGGPAPLSVSVEPSNPVVAISKRQSKKVTPQDLIHDLMRYDRPLIAMRDAKGAEWSLRHPDLDGSGFTGHVFLPGGESVMSELGFVITSDPNVLRALEKMGWVLWRTSVNDSRPARFDGVY